MELVKSHDGIFEIKNDNYLCKINKNGDILNIEEILRKMNIDDKELLKHKNIRDILKESSKYEKLYQFIFDVNKLYSATELSFENNKLKKKIKNNLDVIDSDESNEFDIMIDKLYLSLVAYNIKNFDKDKFVKELKGGNINSIDILTHEINNIIEPVNIDKYYIELQNIIDEISNTQNERNNVGINEEVKNALDERINELIKRRDTVKQIIVTKNNFNFSKDILLKNADKIKDRIITLEKLLSNYNNVDKKIIQQFLEGNYIDDMKINNKDYTTIKELTIDTKYNNINTQIQDLFDVLMNQENNDNNNESLPSVADILVLSKNLRKNIKDLDKLKKIDTLIEIVNEMIHKQENMSEFTEKKLNEKMINKDNEKQYELNSNNIKGGNYDESMLDSLVNFMEMNNSVNNEIIELNRVFNQFYKFSKFSNISTIKHKIDDYERNAYIENLVEYIYEHNLKLKDINIFNLIVSMNGILEYNIDYNLVCEKYNIKVHTNENLNKKAYDECVKLYYILEMKANIAFIKLLEDPNNKYGLNEKYLVIPDDTNYFAIQQFKDYLRIIYELSNKILILLINDIDIVKHRLIEINREEKIKYKANKSFRIGILIFGAILIIALIIGICVYYKNKNEHKMISNELKIPINEYSYYIRKM